MGADRWQAVMTGHPYVLVESRQELKSRAGTGDLGQRDRAIERSSRAHWTANLKLPVSGRVGTFQFTPIGCSGSLVITKTTSTTVSMYEDLTGNSQGLCAPGGMITLTRTSSGTADMSWQDSTVPGNTATGQLVGG